MLRPGWWVGLCLLAASACSGDADDDDDDGRDAGPDAQPATDAGGQTDAAVDASVDAGPEVLDIGILSAERGSIWEAESHLVVGPDGSVLVVWMSLRANALVNGYAFSPDRGRTWEGPSRMDATSTLGDPVATVTADGDFFYGWLDGTCGAGGCSSGHFWVARWDAAAGAFGEPVDASPADPDAFYDKPWLMTGADGALVAVFASRIGEYPNNVDAVVAARSTDGLDWSRTFVVEPGETGRIAGIPHACASVSAARVWALFVDLDSPIYASLRWSDDYGATWPADDASVEFVDPGDALELQSYDLRCAGEGDEVWVMYGLASSPSDASSIPPLDEIRVVHSGDGGSTWDPPSTIALDGVLFLRPEIARAPSGTLHVMAYSGASDGDRQGSVRRWSSDDGGASWVEQEPIHAPLHFDGSRADDFWLGDYSGFAVDGDDLFVSYIDNEDGAAHVAFHRTGPAN